MNITENEFAVLENIALNEFAPNNGAMPEQCWEATTWSDSIDCGPNNIESTSIPGIVGSLSKKGLIKSDGESVYHTGEGFKIFTKMTKR